MQLILQVPTKLTVQVAWQTLTDWRAHAKWIPLTKMIILHEGTEPGLGDKFIGRTGIGRLAFDDVMTVTRFEPPIDGGHAAAFCEVTKSGRLIKGSASFKVEAAPFGAVVTWTEDIPLPHLVEKLLGWALKIAGGVVFKYALDKALRA